MSADMLILSIPMYGTYKPNVESDLDNRKRSMLYEISQASAKDIEDFKTNLADGNYVLEDFEKSPGELMTDIVEEFFKALGGRDVTFQIFGEMTAWLTGGMSWGDEPTDAFSKFEMFNYLPYNVRIAGAFQ